MNEKAGAPIRLDKWLWCTRFYKTRSLASTALKRGKILVNGERAKPSKSVTPGDQLNIRRGPYRYDITILGLAKTRQPASATSFLYEESPESISTREHLASQLKAEVLLKPSTKGRPSKKDRRSIIKFKNS